jgi:hypothetical protein
MDRRPPTLLRDLVLPRAEPRLPLRSLPVPVSRDPQDADCPWD